MLGGSQSYNPIRTKVVTVTSAQLLSSFDSPIELLASPGANRFYNVINAKVYYNFGTIAYATNLILQFRYGSGVLTPGWASNTAIILSGVADLFYFLTTGGITNNYSKSDFTDKGLYLSTNTGNPTAGDGDIEIYLTYTIES